MQHHNDIFSDDAQMRCAFHSGLPDAPATPWFTRKVMNRLPPPRRRLINRVEWVAYGLAALLLATYWIGWLCGILDRGVVTVADLVDMLMLLAFSLLPVAAIMAPKITTWIRE